MSFSLNGRPLSKKAIRLSEKLMDKANDPQVIIDTATILTLLAHEYILNTEGVEATRKFLDSWIEMLKHNVEHIILNEHTNKQEE